MIRVPIRDYPTTPRFVGGGHTTFCGFLNMGVHVVMYFYYLMSAMGPAVQKYLWWKRYDKNPSYQSYNTNYLLCSLVSMLSREKYTQYLNVNAMSVMIKSEEIESKQIHLHRTLNKPAKQL